MIGARTTWWLGFAEKQKATTITSAPHSLAVSVLRRSSQHPVSPRAETRHWTGTPETYETLTGPHLPIHLIHSREPAQHESPNWSNATTKSLAPSQLHGKHRTPSLDLLQFVVAPDRTLICGAPIFTRFHRPHLIDQLPIPSQHFTAAQL